jgi:hypothetical protein
MWLAITYINTSSLPSHSRKVNESDASAFAKQFGGDSRCWGVFWLIISLAFFAAGIVVGIVAFKDTEAQQRASKFLDTRDVKY